MILFRDVYKSANDDIIPDSQLLDKILAHEPEKKKPIYPFFVKYGSAAAAFLILVGTLAIYPKLSKTLNTTNDKAVPGTDVVTGISETASPEALPNLEDLQPKATKEASTNTKNEKAEEAIVEKDLKQQGSGEQITKEKTLPEVSLSPSPTENAEGKAESDGAVITASTQPEISEPSVSLANETNRADDLSHDKNVPKTASSEDTKAIPAANPAVQKETSEEAIAPASAKALDSEAYSARRSSTEDSSPGKGGGGGGSASSGGSSAKATQSAKIAESKAIELANKAFLQDFGEEFLSSSKIKTEFNEHYIITRYNENETYTVTVTTDGVLKKQY